MTNQIADISIRKAAVIAGFGYLIIFITGIFSNFFVLESLVVTGNAAKTTNNIIDIQNSTIEIDLFIEKVHFDKDKFYIPLISNDYKILQNYNPSQTVAEFSSSEGM